jgi:hypothetical protein
MKKLRRCGGCRHRLVQTYSNIISDFSVKFSYTPQEVWEFFNLTRQFRQGVLKVHFTGSKHPSSQNARRKADREIRKCHRTRAVILTAAFSGIRVTFFQFSARVSLGSYQISNLFFGEYVV